MYTAVDVHLHDNARRNRQFYVLDEILDEFVDFMESYVIDNPFDVVTLDDWYTTDMLPYETKQSQVIEELPHELWVAWLYDALGGNE